MGKSARLPDVINVNQRWSVWIGQPFGVAYWHGTVLAPDRLTALRTAREQHPDTRIGFVKRERWS